MGSQPTNVPAPGDVGHPVSPSAVTPERLIQLYTSEDWESFIREWTDGFDPPYSHVDHLGGPGDKGRDIVAYAGPDRTGCDIDLFQCKHYDHPLHPTDIWLELGKLCVFTRTGAFRLPRKYFFVAPQGVGTKLADLLANPDRLRSELLLQWPSYCEGFISKSQKYPLDLALRTYIQTLDFGIFDYLPVHKILEQHARTKHWHARFKRDFPQRPAGAAAPSAVQSAELRYVEQLLGAYSDHLKSPVAKVEDLHSHAPLREHFQRARTDFFKAESLNRFYRDQFTEGAFEHVKQQVLDGVVEIANDKHEDGLARVKATTQQAIVTPLAQTDYTPYVEPGDKKGLCHHLANDDKLKWVPK